MIEIQTLLTYLTLVSVPIGVFYHILTLWNSQKARQTQILLQLYQTMSNPENNQVMWELLALEWDDYNDFQEKHSPQVDPENASKRQALWNQYEGLGLLVKNKVVDLNTEDFDYPWFLSANVILPKFKEKTDSNQSITPI
jgi:hypothetical protein